MVNKVFIQSKCVVALLLFCHITCVCMAQFYSKGVDPMSVDWYQYDAGHYRWVADKQVMPHIGFYRTFMDSLVCRGGLSLGEMPNDIDILFHSRTSYSNGFVSWAPKRMELYLSPFASDVSIPWLQHLLVHEYRHVVQMSSLNRGFTKGLYFLFGEQAIGLISGLYTPKWLLEGDAVATETALTHGGRGRSASFVQEMRALTLSDNFPKYDAAYNGSYAERYPNYYHMGYYTVAYLRQKYGADVLASVFDKCGRKSWSITPFNRALRNISGKRKAALYSEALSWWKTLWRSEMGSIEPTPYISWQIKRKAYADYHLPKFTQQGIVAYKESPETLPRFVFIDIAGKESTLFIPSQRNEINYDVNDSLLVWTERHNHVRWENADRSVIKIMDIKNRKCRTLRAECFYTSVSLSAGGDSLVVVSTHLDSRQTIDVIDLEGRLLRRIEMPQAVNVASPIIATDGTVYAVETSVDGACIVSYPANKMLSRHLVADLGYTNVRYLTLSADTLYFSSDATGVNNIYMYALQSGKLQRLTSSLYGAEMPYVRENTLLYADYSHMGYTPVVSTISQRPTDTPHSLTYDIADTLTALEGRPIEADFSQTPLPASSYTKANLFNIHSWGLINADASTVSLKPSLALSSQNLLSSMIFRAGFNYDMTDTDEILWTELSYVGLYPKLSLRGTVGYKKLSHSELINRYDENGLPEELILEYDGSNILKKLSLGITQPLQWNRGAWRRGVSFGVAAELRSNSGVEYYIYRKNTVFGQRKRRIVEQGKINDEKYLDINYNFSAHLLRRLAERDIESRLGISFESSYQHTPLFDDLGSCSALSLNVYLPGVAPHHTININFALQRKEASATLENIHGETVSMMMNDMISMPRGYDVFNNRLKVCRLNYTMPLFCPDWNIGGLTYMKRFRTRLFYDIAHVTQISGKRIYHSEFNISSVGCELYVDTHWLRLPFPVTIGYRLTRRIEMSDFTGGFLFNISF